MAESPSELHAEIEKLERKHAEHPEGRYFVPLANAYRKLGEVGHAEALLREGLRRHPDYLSAHIVLGRCLADRSATREATEEFRYVLSLDPQNLIALRTLGELAAAEGRAPEAERWYEELLAVDPMNDEARRSLGTLRGTTAPAEEEFRPDAAWWEREPEEQPRPEPQPEPAPAEEEEAEEEEEVLVFTAPAPEQPAPVEALAPEEEPVEEPVEEGSALDAGPEEVVTETIAELYARQGFLERAADVYRELIRRRGGDAALERRLAEVEAKLRGEEPAPEALPAAEQEQEQEQDTFAASFADGFYTAAPVEVEEEEVEEEEEGTEVAAMEAAAPQVSAEPEVPAPAAAVAQETIGTYLRALIAWSPAAEPVEVIVEEMPAAELPALEETPEPAPFPTPAPEPEPAGEEPGTGPAEAELFPWELPVETPRQLAQDEMWAPTPAPEPQPEPTPPELPIRSEDDFFSFDAFVSESPAEGPAGAEERPAATPAPPSEAAAEEEDDDLESFQAWLRSLKR